MKTGSAGPAGEHTSTADGQTDPTFTSEYGSCCACQILFLKPESFQGDAPWSSSGPLSLPTASVSGVCDSPVNQLAQGTAKMCFSQEPLRVSTLNQAECSDKCCCLQGFLGL